MADTKQMHVVALVGEGTSMFDLAVAYEVFGRRPTDREPVVPLHGGDRGARRRPTRPRTEPDDRTWHRRRFAPPTRSSWPAGRKPPRLHRHWSAPSAAPTAAALRIVSFCSGTFLLAAAGLLDGRRATTHWDATDRFRSRYPDCRHRRRRPVRRQRRHPHLGRVRVGHRPRHPSRSKRSRLARGQPRGPPTRGRPPPPRRASAVRHRPRHDGRARRQPRRHPRMDHRPPRTAICRSRPWPTTPTSAHGSSPDGSKKPPAPPPTNGSSANGSCVPANSSNKARCPSSRSPATAASRSTAAMRPHFTRYVTTSPAAYKRNFAPR